ncbi:hypothetical protein ACFT5B_14180 [Luteimicrobium sp. NPDC057192]|uniref:hypothetical protein n=1 Tax=Luteimicrobium sp. NPDC057192 TaxID=3346042 RepID=UPI00362F2E60
MSVLSDARSELAQLLEAAGIDGVRDYLPERMSPPLVYVTGGSPALEPGQVYGMHLLRYDLTAVARSGANETVTDALDELVVKVLAALDGNAWAFETAGRPFMQSADTKAFIAQRLTFITNRPVLGD